MTTLLRCQQTMFLSIILGMILAGGQPVQGEPKTVTIEGRFGKAEVDVAHPALVTLTLRAANGQLSEQSLLATSGTKPWAKGGYTYVVGPDKVRRESRLAAPKKADVSNEAGRNVLYLAGVTLSDGTSKDVVASEDWRLAAPGDGSQLVWTITREWKKDFTVTMSGSPGLFFAFDARQKKNSVTSTLWYDPSRMTARWSDLYQSGNRMTGRVSDNLVQTIRDRNAWAIYKLWTNWHAPADLRLEVDGGYLYRRGSMAHLSEAGSVTRADEIVTHHAGQVEKITLTAGGVDKCTTGYQLAVTLPDKETEAALKDFYGSVLNGGSVNDQKGFDFGNESDGWYHAGSSWMYGAALGAGLPASGTPSSRPYDAMRAFREHLAHILSVLDEQGRAHFGYNQNGEWVDDNLHTILGMYHYLLHSGDLAFVRQSLPSLEHMLAYFIHRRNDKGLFVLKKCGAHWYYDAINTSGVNGYHNSFFYKAAHDLAEMEAAVGRAEKASEYRAVAQQVKKAFNEVLWKEDAVGDPRYLDWIDVQGKEVAYFCDLCQWPPIAVGIASPSQAHKIVATADARIAQLEKEHGYQGFAGLSALWPVPSPLNPISWQTYGRYMNGGSLLCQTYWEILARACAGDNEGAARRLRQFARHAAKISWAGDNAANIKGDMANGDGEPYLADMVVVAASVVHGVLGVTPTWDRLEVTPHLPAGWPRAEADILYKGRRHHIAIENGKVHIQPLEQVADLPPTWTMDFNLRAAPGGIPTSSHVDSLGMYGAGKWHASADPKRAPILSNVEFLEPYGHAVVLAKGASSGTYQSPPHDWAMPVRLAELTVTVDLHGGRGTAIVETSNDGFKTVSASSSIALRDGVNDYPMSLAAPARIVRLRFELARGSDASTTPVLDGFRVLAASQEGKAPLGNRAGSP